MLHGGTSPPPPAPGVPSLVYAPLFILANATEGASAPGTVMQGGRASSPDAQRAGWLGMCGCDGAYCGMVEGGRGRACGGGWAGCRLEREAKLEPSSVQRGSAGGL